jgi:hypothetical protein
VTAQSAAMPAMVGWAYSGFMVDTTSYLYFGNNRNGSDTVQRDPTLPRAFA